VRGHRGASRSRSRAGIRRSIATSWPNRPLSATSRSLAYCLMPKDVHLILAPSDATGLGRAVGEAHRRTTNFIAWALDRPSVPEPVRVGGYERKSPDRGGEPRQSQSRAGAPGAQGGGLGVVERARSSDKEEQRIGLGRAGTEPGRPVRGLARIRFGRWSLPRASVVGGKRTPAWKCRLRRRPRTFAGPVARRAPRRKSKRARSGAVGSAEVKATENRYHVAVFHLTCRSGRDQRLSRDRLTRQPQEHQHSAAAGGMRDRLPPARDSFAHCMNWPFLRNQSSKASLVRLESAISSSACLRKAS